MDAHGKDSIGTITISSESLTSVHIARGQKSYQSEIETIRFFYNGRENNEITFSCFKKKLHMSMEPVKQ